MRYNVICIIFLLIICHSFADTGVLHAQEIKVTDCYIVPEDKSAQEYQKFDGNGELCALLKIRTNGISNLRFPNQNQYKEVETKANEYWIYIPTLSYRITFSHPDYQQGTIDLSVFGFKKNIKGGRTYVVKLEAPKKMTENFVSFKVSPIIKGCNVVLDGNTMPLPNNGIVEFPCSPGTHRYRVDAPDYETSSGSVTVTNGVVPVSVQLLPSTVPVRIVCNVDATVYVDDVKYGKTGTLNVPIGSHKIRLVCNGYVDSEKDIKIDPEVTTLFFNMDKNKGKKIDIHPVKVTIYCNTINLFKNNKKIEDWHGSGSVLLMMPSTKCRISDDDGKGAILTVGNEDMEIKLENGVIKHVKKE